MLKLEQSSSLVMTILAATTMTHAQGAFATTTKVVAKTVAATTVTHTQTPTTAQITSALPNGLLDRLILAIRVNPNDLNLRRLLAQEFMTRGLTAKAAEQIKEVMHVAGENASDLIVYADACRYTGNFQEAITSYKKCLTLAPMNAKAWSGLSLAYAQTGDRQSAMNTCRSGLLQIPDLSGRKELSGTLNSIQNMAPAQTESPVHIAS